MKRNVANGQSITSSRSLVQSPTTRGTGTGGGGSGQALAINMNLSGSFVAKGTDLVYVLNKLVKLEARA